MKQGTVIWKATQVLTLQDSGPWHPIYIRLPTPPQTMDVGGLVSHLLYCGIQILTIWPPSLSLSWRRTQFEGLSIKNDWLWLWFKRQTEYISRYRWRVCENQGNNFDLLLVGVSLTGTLLSHSQIMCSSVWICLKFERKFYEALQLLDEMLEPGFWIHSSQLLDHALLHLISI